MKNTIRWEKYKHGKREIHVLLINGWIRAAIVPEADTKKFCVLTENVQQLDENLTEAKADAMRQVQVWL